MGYNTDFVGSFELDAPLTKEQVAAINDINEEVPTGLPEPPDSWCDWVVYDNQIEWNGSEKSYQYVEWIQYLVKHFVIPWGRTLNGEVEWFGEEPKDLGKIVIKDNIVQVKTGRVVYE